MAFWTSPGIEPARQNRWRIIFTPSPEKAKEMQQAIHDIQRMNRTMADLAFGGEDTGGAFLKNKNTEFLWKIPAASDYWWWAKSCTLPGFEIGQTDYQLLNQKFKYPGMLVWNDITITMVDVGGRIEQILGMLKSAGYTCPGDVSTEKCAVDGIQKGSFSAQGQLRIQQVNASGIAVRTWLLRNWFMKAVRFGELNYESDEFVSTEMTIGYDCAVLDTEDVAGD
jgi:hypothetical protein